MKVSEALKKYQKENNYTYQKTAETLHMSKSTIYAYMNNLRNPSMESIRKLSKAFKICPVDLLDDMLNPLEEQLLKELRKNRKIYQKVLQNPSIIIEQLEKNNEITTRI